MITTETKLSIFYFVRFEDSCPEIVFRHNSTLNYGFFLVENKTILCAGVIEQQHTRLAIGILESKTPSH